MGQDTTRKWLWPLAFEFGRIVRLWPFEDCRIGMSDARAEWFVLMARAIGEGRSGWTVPPDWWAVFGTELHNAKRPRG